MPRSTIEEKKSINKESARKSRLKKQNLIESLEKECRTLYKKCETLIPKDQIPDIPEKNIFTIRSRAPYLTTDKISERKRRNAEYSKKSRIKKEEYIGRMQQAIQEYVKLLTRNPKAPLEESEPIDENLERASPAPSIAISHLDNPNQDGSLEINAHTFSMISNDLDHSYPLAFATGELLKSPAPPMLVSNFQNPDDETTQLSEEDIRQIEITTKVTCAEILSFCLPNS